MQSLRLELDASELDFEQTRTPLRPGTGEPRDGPDNTDGLA
jgi:hypothetical protein